MQIRYGKSPGTGSGQIRTILSDTATILTISARPEENWTTNPDGTSTYQIIDGFERQGFLNKINCQTASDQPLSWRVNMQFQVETVA